jgi:replicative DNA helicase
VATKTTEVLSAVVKNGDIHAILGEDAKLFGAYGDVFEFLKSYYFKYKAVPDKSLLTNEFRDLDLVDTTAPTKFYLEQLRNDYVKSRIEEIMLKAGSALQGGDKSSPEVLSTLQTALSKLGRFTSAARDLDITNADLAEEHFKKLREISDEKGGTPGISTGFKSIDSAYTTGMAGGHSIVLMGYTGRAKSMWSSLLATKAWEQGYKPMIVSLEMTPEEQMERIYAMMSSGLFRISDLSRGNISLDDFRAWSGKKFDGAAQFVVVSNEGVSDVTPNIVQAKIDTHRPDFVILDYMQLMMDNSMTGAMTPRMLNLSREIKMLAVSNNIPIVSITAVTDEDGDKRDAPPMLSQVAWSRAIEYDANLVIAVHRHDDSNLVEVVGRKNRHGNLFDFYFDVDFDRGIWEEKFQL